MDIHVLIWTIESQPSKGLSLIRESTKVILMYNSQAWDSGSAAADWGSAVADWGSAVGAA